MRRHSWGVSLPRLPQHRLNPSLSTKNRSECRVKANAESKSPVGTSSVRTNVMERLSVAVEDVISEWIYLGNNLQPCAVVVLMRGPLSSEVKRSIIRNSSYKKVEGNRRALFKAAPAQSHIFHLLGTPDFVLRGTFRTRPPSRTCQPQYTAY